MLYGHAEALFKNARQAAAAQPYGGQCAAQCFGVRIVEAYQSFCPLRRLCVRVVAEQIRPAAFAWPEVGGFRLKSGVEVEDVFWQGLFDLHDGLQYIPVLRTP